VYDLTRLPAIAGSLESFDRDCAITVALKIADESCKMDDYEKSVFMALYEALPTKESDFFEEDVFDVIRMAKNTPSAQVYSKVKKMRESAMDMISRPKMKAFKASIREKLLD